MRQTRVKFILVSKLRQFIDLGQKDFTEIRSMHTAITLVNLAEITEIMHSNQEATGTANLLESRAVQVDSETTYF